MADVSFAKWLEDTLTANNLSQSDLARKSGVTRAAINGVLTGARGPGPELCLAIAKALHIPPEEVFRAAGLLPPNKNTDVIDERANHLIQTLKKPSSKQRAIDYLQLLIEQEEREERENAAKKNHPATQPR